MNHQVDSFRSVTKLNSLSFRLLIGMLFWLLCAFVFTGYTLMLSWELEKVGMAINDAGSLRKRTFQMALTYDYYRDISPELRQQQYDFEQALYNLRHVGGGKTFMPNDESLSVQVKKIDNQWHETLLPWYQQLAQTHAAITTENRHVVDDYANDINHLVKLIEEENTRNIQLLRLFQMLLILMTFVTAITGIYLSYRLVISPLDTLRGGIVRLALGDLKARIRKHSEDEFGIVADGFNQMAENLQDAHSNLEQKITEKTQALANRNHELSSLYAITAYLHDSHSIETTAHGFVTRMMDMTGADAGSIRLLDDQRKALDYLAAQGLPETMLQPTALCTQMEKCQCKITSQEAIEIPINLHVMSAAQLPCCLAGFAEVRAFTIRFSQQDLGLFTLYFKTKNMLTAETARLIESLSGQLGVAIENQRLIDSGQQYAVSEERNLMAQDLHDSIAQSLSYLNLQTQMMAAALHGQQYDDAQEYLASIQNGVQESYDDVRELLLNFRTRLAEQDFSTSVQAVLQRFESQTQIPARLKTEGDGARLSPQQQLQVIFILQEALSNIRKHAQASEVQITMTNQDDFQLIIEDDGQGFDAQTLAQKQSGHVGTHIMQERANNIHAELTIESKIGRGTQVSLRLPANQRVIL